MSMIDLSKRKHKSIPKNIRTNLPRPNLYFEKLKNSMSNSKIQPLTSEDIDMNVIVDPLQIDETVSARPRSRNVSGTLSPAVLSGCKDKLSAEKLSCGSAEKAFSFHLQPVEH